MGQTGQRPVWTATSTQLGPLPLHLFQHGAELRQTLALLLDHGGRGALHEALAGQLAAGLADLALQAGNFLVQAGAFGSHVDFHLQHQAVIAHHLHRGQRVFRQ